MSLAVLVFVVLFVCACWLIDAFHLPYQDELWLSGVLASIALSIFKPAPRTGFFKDTVLYVLLIFGAYVIALKVTWMFSGFINYRLAGLMCLVLYVGCWLLIQRRLSSSA